MSRWLFFPSTGPSLIIHDAFGGSGNVAGRTPDTVNNGNNWEVSGTSGMRVLSGFMTLGTDNNGESRAIVDPDSSIFKIVMKSQALTWGGTAPKPGIVTHYAASPLRRTLLYLEGSNLQRWESHAGGSSFTILGTYGAPSTNVLDWEVEMDGTSMTYLIKDGATTMYSGTTTNQNSTNTAGYYQQFNNTDLTYCLDFKVYA